MIDLSVDWDDAPFWEMYPKLKAALSHIRRGVVLYEREPEGGPRWGETADPDEDPPDWHDEARSYGLFFISAIDERLTFVTDTIEPEEGGIERRFPGEGRVGYVVAVSLVAPFGVVALDQTLPDRQRFGSMPSSGLTSHAALDAPARAGTRLKKVLREPSVFERRRR